MDNSLLAVRDINHKYIVVESEKTGQEGKHEPRIDDIGLLAGYGHI